MRDPTRRNRNIGTARQGRGQHNRLVIPDSCPEERLFYEILDDAVPVSQRVGGRDVTFLVQPVSAGFVHACTVDDICRMLGHVPEGEHAGIDLVVLRQPTRKQVILRNCWGRLCYHADTGRHSGRAILIEAQDPGRPLRWSRSMTPEDAAELDRLKADGHGIEADRRGFTLTPNAASIRATQLYRTLLHELGHHVDFRTKVGEPAKDLEAYGRRQARYFARPNREREAFAHRYADELAARLRDAGAIPFARIEHRAGMARDGLDPAWFGVG